MERVIEIGFKKPNMDLTKINPYYTVEQTPKNSSGLTFTIITLIIILVLLYVFSQRNEEEKTETYSNS